MRSLVPNTLLYRSRIIAEIKTIRISNPPCEFELQYIPGSSKTKLQEAIPQEADPYDGPKMVSYSISPNTVMSNLHSETTQFANNCWCPTLHTASLHIVDSYWPGRCPACGAKLEYVRHCGRCGRVLKTELEGSAHWHE